MTDATIKTQPRTIRLKGVGERIERVAGGTVNPGHLVQLNSSNQLVVHSSAGKKAATIFALENELVGKGIDDAYTSAADLVQAEHFDQGDWVLARLAAAATAVLIGDKMESAGDGTLRKTTGDYEDFIGIAMEAVDNSGGGSEAFIMVAIA